jgi:soluble cytochrome b562
MARLHLFQRRVSQPASLKLPITIIMAVSLSVLTACASVPTKRVVEVAKAGETAASSLRTQLAEQSRIMSRADELDVFKNTYDACFTARRADINAVCQNETPDKTLQDSRDKYVELVKRRTAALSKLEAVYKAMREDAESDPKKEFAEGLDALTKETDAVLKLVNMDPLSDTIKAAVKEIFGLVAKDKQARRIKLANLVIADVTDKLATALSKETEVHDGFFVLVSIEQADVRRRFRRSGVYDYEDRLKNFAALSGLTLSDAELKLALEDPFITQGLFAATDLQESRRKGLKAPFAKSVQVLKAMSVMHTEIDEFRESDIDLVIRLVGEARDVHEAITKTQDGTDPTTPEETNTSEDDNDKS